MTFNYLIPKCLSDWLKTTFWYHITFVQSIDFDSSYDTSIQQYFPLAYGQSILFWIKAVGFRIDEKGEIEELGKALHNKNG